MLKDNPIKKFIAKYKVRLRVGVIIGIVIFVYMFVATGEAIWQNYRINQEIVQLKLEIAQLEQQNAAFKNLIAYLKTESFKEKEARRKLGYRKPGEQVVAIPQDNFINTDPGNTKGDAPVDNQPHLTNPQKWWEYVLG